MLIKQSDDIKSSEITPERVYFSRRNFMRAGLLAGSAMATGALYRRFLAPIPEVNYQDPNVIARGTVSDAGEALTPYSDITSYNNYYEFTTDKYGVARRARNFVTRPWTVTVDGLVNHPKVYDLDDLLKLAPIEERIYRLRCVEGWSMVIPWLGLSLAAVLKDVEPSGNARYVAFQTIEAPKQMPGWNASGLDLPYVEGLRLDETMHPLTLLASGIYGQPLPSQNGAPIRLVVPWKYGFKSIKSIVKITLTDREPKTTWNIAAPREYGFYSNVNPDVAHPRWSQAKERRIGEFFRRDTLLFNGYADQVAQLYAGMNLRKNF